MNWFMTEKYGCINLDHFSRIYVRQYEYHCSVLAESNIEGKEGILYYVPLRYFTEKDDADLFLLRLINKIGEK